MRAIILLLATRPIKYYSYSYCVDGSDIYADINYVTVSALSLNHDFHKDEKLVKVLSVQLPSFRGHPGLAKYHTFWETFSRYFLLDTFSLVGLYNWDSKSLYHRPLLGRSPPQLDCREYWIYAYRIHQFSKSQNDHPYSIDLGILLY